MELGQYGWTRNLSYYQTHPEFIISAPPATPNYGLINLGNAPFDGISTGTFVGSIAGTYQAINAASGYTGNFVDYQVSGISKFAIGYAGTINVNRGDNGLNVINIRATPTAYITSNNSGGQPLILGNQDATTWAQVQIAGDHSLPALPSATCLAVVGSVGQTAALQSWYDSNFVTLSSIDNLGHLSLSATPQGALTAWGGGD